MLKLHFLNVGHGDCKIIENTNTNRTTMIDINMTSEMDDSTVSEIKEELFSSISIFDRILLESSGKSNSALLSEAGYKIELQNPISYANDNGINHLFRFISTHPHMDHLTGFKELYESITVTNTWIVQNKFYPSTFRDGQKLDWNYYKEIRDTSERKIHDTIVVRPLEADLRDFWNEDGIEILAPNDELLKIANEKNNPNIMSYVLLLTYAGRKIIFGGDAEKETWEYLVATYPHKLSGVCILDASHHGRDSGYFQPAVKIMKPEFTIISVGKKPETDASNKYRTYSPNVFSTRWKGNIMFQFNEDGSGSYSTQFDR